LLQFGAHNHSISRHFFRFRFVAIVVPWRVLQRPTPAISDSNCPLRANLSCALAVSPGLKQFADHSSSKLPPYNAGAQTEYKPELPEFDETSIAFVTQLFGFSLFRHEAALYQRQKILTFDQSRQIWVRCFDSFICGYSCLSKISLAE
jgi:hypothetical protein